MALDPGEKRVGLAVCDPLRVVARPLKTLPRKLRELIAAIQEQQHEREIVGLVVGHPLREDGSRGAQAQRAETLVFHLRQHLPDLPIALVDERWSSAAADEALATASAADQRAGRDAAAAAVILQSFLDETNPE
jgi:putative Holliday junction resolvase